MNQIEPTFVDKKLSKSDENKLNEILHKKFSIQGDFIMSYSICPKTYIITVQCKHLNSNWFTVLLDKKFKILKISDERKHLGKFKTRLDVYLNDKFLISFTFPKEKDAVEYAIAHCNDIKHTGYSPKTIHNLTYAISHIIEIN